MWTKACISINIADEYCNEVGYELNDKMYYYIGFKNDSEVNELTHEFFRGSTSRKDITTIKNKGKKVAIFEGFFDLLSFISLLQNKELKPFSFCILNPLFFEKSRPFLEEYHLIHLYLDNDKAGINAANYAKTLNEKYHDESSLYKNYKDLNDWVINIGKGR